MFEKKFDFLDDAVVTLRADRAADTDVTMVCVSVRDRKGNHAHAFVYGSEILVALAAALTEADVATRGPEAFPKDERDDATPLAECPYCGPGVPPPAVAVAWPPGEREDESAVRCPNCGASGPRGRIERQYGDAGFRGLTAEYEIARASAIAAWNDLPR